MPEQKTSYGRITRIERAHAEGNDVARNGSVDHPAQAALASSSVFELRDLTVCCEGEQMLISGRVKCFYHKQLAQETVRRHAADLRLVNQVSVEQVAAERV